MSIEQLRDIADRLNRAGDALHIKASEAQMWQMDIEAARLRGKHEGVRLAWSYIEEYLRGHDDQEDA